MQEWQAFMRQWMPEGDIRDTFATYGYGTALLLKRVLDQCGGDFSRENIMHQAADGSVKTLGQVAFRSRVDQPG